jgi:hypothetical protein
MSLKAFHLIFVTLLTTLSFGCAAWAFMPDGRVIFGWTGSPPECWSSFTAFIF